MRGSEHTMNNITLGMKRDTSDIKDLFRERRNQAQTSAKKVLIKKKQVQTQAKSWICVTCVT